MSMGDKSGRKVLTWISQQTILNNCWHYRLISSTSHCALSGFDNCICCIQCIYLPYFLSIER